MSPAGPANSIRRPPPLWLAVAAVASGWSAVFSIGRWVARYLQDPLDIDFRLYYFAARLGIEQGWNRIYDQAALKALVAAQFSGAAAVVDSSHTFPNPPLLAWIIAPLTSLPYGPAYAAWTLAGVLCLLFAWWVACPYQGVARLTLLCVAVAIWPIHYSFVLGQPTPEVLALVAGGWWLLRRARPLEAGLALAVATALKPQDVILVPFVLLFAGHGRLFLSWGVGCAVLAALFVASLGWSGLGDFWHTTLEVESDSSHHIWTLASVAGPGLPGRVLEVAAVIGALLVAWRHRDSPELVIAIGLAGSVLSAVHEHETDATMLVLAAWLVLRSPAGGWARLWLLPGIACAQAMSIGLVPPIFVWEIGWLALLAADRARGARNPASQTLAATAGANPTSPPAFSTRLRGCWR